MPARRKQGKGQIQTVGMITQESETHNGAARGQESKIQSTKSEVRRAKIAGSKLTFFVLRTSLLVLCIYSRPKDLCLVSWPALFRRPYPFFLRIPSEAR